MSGQRAKPGNRRVRLGEIDVGAHGSVVLVVRSPALRGVDQAAGVTVSDHYRAQAVGFVVLHSISFGMVAAEGLSRRTVTPQAPAALLPPSANAAGAAILRSILPLQLPYPLPG